MRIVERDGRRYCTRGHLLNAETFYTEPTSGRQRCKVCSREARNRQRRKKRLMVGRADLATRVNRQRPTPGDIERALKRWADGDAAAACEHHDIGPGDLAKVVGCHRVTTASWLAGGRIQKRFHRVAAQILLALDTIRSDDPVQAHVDRIEAEFGDALLIVGWGNRLGPWHASPPHTPEIRQHMINTGAFRGLTDPEKPRRYVGYVPSLGLIDLTDDLHNHWLNRYAHAHGYTDRQADRWYPDQNPPPKAWIVYQWALADGQTCIPGCARCAAVRHGNDDTIFPECPETCPQCATEHLAELRANHKDPTPETAANDHHNNPQPQPK